jgi:hypothetical protein
LVQDVQRLLLLKFPEVTGKDSVAQISPEGTGLKNTLVTRPAGSSYFNEPNISISTKFLIPSFNYKFYQSNTKQILQQKEAERAKNQVLLQLLDPHKSLSELFRVFSKLIGIHSIMIEVHGEVDQNQVSKSSSSSIISRNFLSSQINDNQWYSFFKTMDMINSNNFNIIAWFKGCEQGKFEHEEEVLDPKVYGEKIYHYK